MKATTTRRSLLVLFMIASVQCAIAQARKPNVVILATGGTIAGAAATGTQSGYTSGAVTIDAMINAVPGILAASPSTSLPPYGGIGSEIDIPGKSHTERWNSMYQLVDQGYFPTLGLKIVSGRALNEIEVTGARKSAVVNQAFVKKYFGKENPLGQMVRIKNLETDREYPIPNAMFEIVGVTADAKNRGIQEDPQPEMFIPYSITNQYFRGLLVRNELLSLSREWRWRPLAWKAPASTMSTRP